MAGPDPPDVLALRHVPELRYHKLEPYRADSPATMTDSFAANNYSNGLRSGKTGDILAMAKPVGRYRALSLSFLVSKDEPYWDHGPAAGPDDYLVVNDRDRQGDSHRIRHRPGYGDVAYCWYLPRNGPVRYLQYWLFYYDNVYMGAFGHHEGDWELVQVELDGSGALAAAVYHQHDGAVRRELGEFETVDDEGVRPVVYVAKGSHANYFEAKTHKRFGVLRDHTSSRGDHVIPRVHLVDPAVDRWVEWPGRWGDSPDSPQGPCHHTAWRDPEAWKRPAGGPEAVELAEVPDAQPGAVPLEPVVRSTQIEAGALVADYVLPSRREPGRSDPVRLELALYGASGPPSVDVFDVTALEATVRVRLPPSGPPYRLETGVYDVDDHEVLLEPVNVGEPETVRAPAGPESPPPPPPPPGGAAAVRRRPAGVDQIRVTVRAPDAEAGAIRELAERAAALETAGAAWKVAPLFGDTNDDDLARWFVLSGDYVPTPGLDGPAAAIEAARELDLHDGWLVEPQVPITSFRTDADEPAGPEAAEAALPHTWAIDAMRCREAWELEPRPHGAARGAGIVIGQPDTGYTDHPELEEGALDRLRDFDVLTGRDDAHAVLRGFPPFAFPSHGTGTASVAISRLSGAITGSAPAAQIVPIRAATSVVHFFNADLAVAVEYARRLGVAVISISMGGIGYPAALRAAIAAAVRDGIIVMAAAGQPLPIVVEPASFPECLGVGGTESGDRWWNLSARGGEIDVAAPAKKVWVAATSKAWLSDRLDYHCAQHTGTSFSVALTAGVAALWLAHHGRDEILRRCGRPNVQAAFNALARATARKPDGWDVNAHGAGIVDAVELLGADPPDASSVDSLAGGPEAPEHDEAAWALEQATRLAGDRMSAEAARERVASVFGGDRDALARHGRELVYRLVEDPRVRFEVLPGAAGPETTAREERFPALAAVTSPSLRADLR